MDNPRVNELVTYFDRIRERTMRGVRCIPPDMLEWTYRQGKFTLGDLVRHLGSIERWMFAETSQRRPSAYPGHGRDLADGYDAVLDYISQMHNDSMTIFGRLSDGDLEEQCITPGGVKMRIGKWLRIMIEHEVHHRGQIYVYLGMLGVPTPPIFGLTEEEVVRYSMPVAK